MRRNKIVSLVLAALLCLSLMPAGALAAERASEEPTSEMAAAIEEPAVVEEEPAVEEELPVIEEESDLKEEPVTDGEGEMATYTVNVYFETKGIHLWYNHYDNVPGEWYDWDGTYHDYYQAASVKLTGTVGEETEIPAEYLDPDHWASGGRVNSYNAYWPETGYSQYMELNTNEYGNAWEPSPEVIQADGSTVVDITFYFDYTVVWDAQEWGALSNGSKTITYSGLDYGEWSDMWYYSGLADPNEGYKFNTFRARYLTGDHAGSDVRLRDGNGHVDVDYWGEYSRERGCVLLTGSVIFYATYTYEASIVYDGNAEDATNVPKATTDTGVTGYNSPGTATVTVSSGVPKREGYTFIGWNTEPDGSGKTYAAKDTEDFHAPDSLTLYAQWEKSSIKVEKKDNPTETITRTYFYPERREEVLGLYNLGDQVEFTITVTNDGETDLHDVTVSDPMTGDEWTIEALAVGESREFTAYYTITQKDIDEQPLLINTATVTGYSPSGTEVTDSDTCEIVQYWPEPGLEIKKEVTSTPADGVAYFEGETISYTITVTNAGNSAKQGLYDVIVTDPLTEDEWTEEKIPGRESVTYTTSYVVTAEDAAAGSVTNAVTGVGYDNQYHDEKYTDTDEVTVKTAVPEPALSVQKETTSTPADGKAYMPGETIEYKITVTNEGNVELVDVTVTDERTGDEWTVESLAAGASESFEASYIVTAEDAAAGSVVNEATATGYISDDPDTPVEPEEPATVEDPIQPEPTPTPGPTATPEPVNYTVTYVPNGGTGEMMPDIVPADDGTYTIRDNGFTAPAGKTFKGWLINGKLYQPGEAFTVTGDTVVTAQWEGEPENAPAPVASQKPAEPQKATPRTGDNSSIGLWAAVLGLCALGAGVVTLLPRRKNDR